MNLVIEQCEAGPPHVYDGDSPYDWAATNRARNVYALLDEARAELRTGQRSPRRGYLMNMARRYAKAEAAAQAQGDAK